MGVWKMSQLINNTIVIRMDSDYYKEQSHYNVSFNHNPTIDELSTAVLVFMELLEHNFDRSKILISMAKMYSHLVDLEEVRR